MFISKNIIIFAFMIPTKSYIPEKYRISFHLLFWMVYIGSITFFFGSLINIKIVFIRTLISAVYNAIIVYINLYFLMPKFFEKRKLATYLILVHIVLFIIMVLRVYTDYSFPLRFEKGVVIRRYMLTPLHFFSVLISGYGVLLLTMSLKFIKDYFINIELRHRLEYQRVESELKVLRNQINPHFLFNVLGNIYSLAYMKSDTAPVMISKLSEMMRYVLYDCRREKVPLSSEIEYLRNFISLHQLRKDGKMNIRFDVEGNPGSLMIQPLLFLPLFENCFKHGNMEDTTKGWMKSILTVTDNKIKLEIENTFSRLNLNTENKSGGVGLSNIRGRLTLLYPGNHSFTIGIHHNVYSIILTLTLSDEDKQIEHKTNRK